MRSPMETLTASESFNRLLDRALAALLGLAFWYNRRWGPEDFRACPGRADGHLFVMRHGVAACAGCGKLQSRHAPDSEGRDR